MLVVRPAILLLLIAVVSSAQAQTTLFLECVEATGAEDYERAFPACDAALAEEETALTLSAVASAHVQYEVNHDFNVDVLLRCQEQVQRALELEPGNQVALATAADIYAARGDEESLNAAIAQLQWDDAEQEAAERARYEQLLEFARLRMAMTPEEFQALSDQITAVGDLEARLNPQSGVITLGDGLATIDVGENLLYLDPEDTNRVIQAWQNPPMPDTLGMLIPTVRSLFSDTNWAVVLTFTEDGWVDDDDAEDLDYDELLEEMQSDTLTENASREQMGLPTMRLVGWAEPPHYDGDTHRLYWAKELETDYGGEYLTNLNYSTRVLGRRGVLELNAVAGMEMLGEIREHMSDVLGRVHFEQGHRYEDFDPDMDEVAAYGIGALILGKFAGKAGFFAMIGIFLLKAKKLLIVLVVGVIALVKRFFGRSSPASALDEEDDTGVEDPPDDEE